ncbi:surface lipoprotein assembly modifier [Paracoccus isoporae]|nr:surface lipoprotein assembly modifier [Paracoccus isoporae]
MSLLPAAATAEPLSPPTASGAGQGLGTGTSDQAQALREEIARLAAAGRLRAMIPLLERLLSLDPSDGPARLQLATALAETGQDDRARHHYRMVRGARDLPPEIRDHVDASLGALDRRRNWEGYFRFATIRETNPAQQTEVTGFTLGGLDYVIREADRAKPAQGVDVGLGVALLPPLAPDLRARLGLRLDAQIFDGDAPDDVTARLSAGLLRFADRGQRFSVEIYGAERRLDDDPYTRTRGVELAYSRMLGQRSAAYLRLSAEREDHVGTPFHVGTRAASLTLSRVISPQLSVYGGLRLEGRQSGDPGLAGAGASVSLGGQYQFEGGYRLGLTLFHERNRYDGRHALFGIPRKDRRSIVTLQIGNSNLSLGGFSPTLNLGYERQRSTIPFNRYRNLTASIGLTREF